MTRASFPDAVDRFPELIERGLYDEAVRRYRGLFGAGNVRVILFDRIRADGDSVAAETYRFLGLEERPELAPVEPALPAAEPRSAVASLLAKKAALALRRAGMLGVVGRVKGNDLVQRLLYREYAEYPQLSVEDRRAVAPFFVDDIRALERTLGVDLSAWLRDA